METEYKKNRRLAWFKCKEENRGTGITLSVRSFCAGYDARQKEINGREIKGSEFVITWLFIWVACVMAATGLSVTLGVFLFADPFPYTIVYFFIIQGMFTGTFAWLIFLILWSN